MEPVICPPHRPDLKPFVERCIATLKYEWLARYSPTTRADALALLAPFVVYDNTQRPHQGLACHNRTPAEAFPTLPDLPAWPTTVAPNRWLTVAHGRVYRRRVNANGAIRVDCHTYYIGHTLAGLNVLAQLNADQRCLTILDNGRSLKVVPLKGLYPDQLALQDFVARLMDEAYAIEQFRLLHWHQRPDWA